MSNHPIDPTGALTGEPGFPPGDIDEGPIPQRTPGATIGPDAVAEGIVQREERRIGGQR